MPDRPDIVACLTYADGHAAMAFLEADFGTRRYLARDPEGHEWSFGPCAPATQAPAWG